MKQTRLRTVLVLPAVLACICAPVAAQTQTTQWPKEPQIKSDTPQLENPAFIVTSKLDEYRRSCLPMPDNLPDSLNPTAFHETTFTSALGVLRGSADPCEASVALKLFFEGSRGEWTLADATAGLMEVTTHTAAETVAGSIVMRGVHVATPWLAVSLYLADALKEEFEKRKANQPYKDALKLFQDSRGWSGREIDLKTVDLDVQITQKWDTVESIPVKSGQELEKVRPSHERPRLGEYNAGWATYDQRKAALDRLAATEEAELLYDVAALALQRRVLNEFRRPLVGKTCGQRLKEIAGCRAAPSAAPPMPSPTSGAAWVLTDTVISPDYTAGDGNPRSMKISGSSASLVYQNADANGGSVWVNLSFNFSWTPPPASIPAGQPFNISASVADAGTWVGERIWTWNAHGNIVAKGPGLSGQPKVAGGAIITGNIKDPKTWTPSASGSWTGTMPGSATPGQVVDITVQFGLDDQGITGGPLHGTVTYKYAFKYPLQQQRDHNYPAQPQPSAIPSPARLPPNAAPLPPPARVTGAFAGQWSGRWQNDQGESGEDSLVLTEEPNGSLRGTWSGNLPVTGRRIDNHTAMLSGRTATRSYTIDARVEDGVLTLSYSASRLDAGGSYTGRSVLRPTK